MLTSYFVPKILVLLSILSNADARSAGVTATCAAGQEALEASVFHIPMGSLESQNVNFLINGEILDTTLVKSYPTGQDLSFAVQASEGQVFKGVFIRLKAPDGVETTAAFFDLDPNLSPSMKCVEDNPNGDVAGVYHNNNSTKDEVTGMLRLDDAAQFVIIDVSVVFEFASGAWTGYTVNFEAPSPDTLPPTPSPTRSPNKPPTDTLPPTPSPTRSPNKPPTDTLPPTPSPTRSPNKPHPPSQCDEYVTDFKLINPNLDKYDMNYRVPLPDVIDLTEFQNGEINIEAVTSDCPDIQCVALYFSGDARHERSAPYALYGDSDGHFYSGTPRVGEYQELRACAYTDRHCSRDEKCKVVTVDVVEEKGCENEVKGFNLINPNLDKYDKNYKVPLPDVIDLAKFEHGEINIEAVTAECPDIECVALYFSGDSRHERSAPYALYGDSDGHFYSGTPRVGDYQELKACTYTDRDCRYDEKCTSVIVDVVDDEEPQEMKCSECDNGYACGVCLMEVKGGRGMCPLDDHQLRDLNRYNCDPRHSFYESGGEKYCEADGECGTNKSNEHDTCDNYEVYKVVACKDEYYRGLRG